MSRAPLDLDRVFKLRVVVARVGEMDRAKWWNTRGQLGRLGSASVGRGLPRTHAFARARSVFAVASQRCAEIYEHPGSVTLWRLPAEIEEHLEARWERWLDDATAWQPFFREVEGLETADLLLAFRDLGLAADPAARSVASLRRSNEGRAVPLPGTFSGSDEDVELLALGFARGEVGAPAVPYIRRAEG